MDATPPTVPGITLRDGTTIPQLGFGTLAVQPSREASEANIDVTARVVADALAAGYRHIDTAQSYGTERGVGRAIAEAGLPREQLYVTSKLANDNHEPDQVRRSFDRTLADLGLDYVDLFLIHWPLPTRYGGDFVSTWRAVAGLVADGRLRSAGVSNFTPAHLGRIVDETGIVPVVCQFELHPYFANREVVEACRTLGIAVEAHSPLGHNRAPLSDPAITRIAEEHGRSTAQVILGWHLQRGVVAIPKSTNPVRMRENLDSIGFELSALELATIDALDKAEAGRVGPHPDTWEG